MCRPQYYNRLQVPVYFVKIGAALAALMIRAAIAFKACDGTWADAPMDTDFVELFLEAPDVPAAAAKAADRGAIPSRSALSPHKRDERNRALVGTVESDASRRPRQLANRDGGAGPTSMLWPGRLVARAFGQLRRKHRRQERHEGDGQQRAGQAHRVAQQSDDRHHHAAHAPAEAHHQR